MALYGFARLADQVGDAHPGDRGDRLPVLDALEADLDRAFTGDARHPLLRDLTPVLQRRELPREPFARLIEANRRDQRVVRYVTWAELLDYCTLSANPVGELVLHLAGAATPERLAWSDAICSALQVIEHSQDVLEDCEAGRIYLPDEFLAAEGCPEADLVKAPASPALRRVLARLAGRARALLRSGDPLVPSLRGLGTSGGGGLRGRRARGPGCPGGRRLRRDQRKRAVPRGGAWRGALWACGRGGHRDERPAGGGGGRRSGRLAGWTGLRRRRRARQPVRGPRPRLGGATWSTTLEGLNVDNGQHVFMRCCTAYRGFLERLGVTDRVELQRRLSVPVAAPDGRRAWLQRNALPAPAHLAASVLRFAHLPLGERLHAGLTARHMGALDLRDPAVDAQSLGDWLAARGESDAAIERFWDLLVRATLNLPAREASLSLAAKVFQTGLLERADAGDM